MPPGPSSEVLGTHAVDHRLAVRAVRAGRRRQPRAIGEFHQQVVAAAAQRAGNEVHRRRADEAGDEQVGRIVVQVQRSAALLDPAVAHDDDLVGHRHCLDLVMGHVHRRRLQALVQLLDLSAHLHPQLGVEIGQRLVEQEDLRIAHDRAAHRHPLALPARQLARITFEQLAQAQDVGRALDPLGDGRLVDLGQHQRERHVVPDRHVRIQRIVLEHHRNVALLGLHIVDDPAVDGDLAVGDLLQPRQHAQQRRLAAAAGADEHRELAVRYVDVDAAYHLGASERLLYSPYLNRCHACSWVGLG
jgi:hypothetical protein